MTEMDPNRLAIMREAIANYAAADDGWEAIIAEHTMELLSCYDQLIGERDRLRAVLNGRGEQP